MDVAASQIEYSLPSQHCAGGFHKQPLVSVNYDTQTSQGCTLYGVFKGMGDVLAGAPLIYAELERRRKVMVLVFPSVAPFLDLLDFGPRRAALEVIPLSKGLRGLLALVRQLRVLSPDLVVVSPHAPLPAASRKVPLLLWAMRKLFWRSARLAGAGSEPMAYLFDQVVEVDRDLPLAEREWQLYRGIRPGAPATQWTARFSADMYNVNKFEQQFDVVIHPGAGSENRKWPRERYGQLIELLPPDISVAVTGLPSDVEMIRQVSPAGRNITYFTGSLRDGIVFLGNARVALTMDSGSMFFASMLGVNTVALFGPSAPAFVIPRDLPISPVLKQTVPCQPCRSATCRLPEVVCMISIDARDVATQILASLAKSSPRAFSGISAR